MNPLHDSGSASVGPSKKSPWCLELHDLWVSKALAGREKDREFCQALVRRGVVMPDVLASRVDATPALDPRVRDVARTWIIA